MSRRTPSGVAVRDVRRRDRWSARIHAPGALTRSVRLSAFDPHGNAITPIRLLLALTVLVSHSFVIGGFGLEPLVVESGYTSSLGIVAVLGFFVVSGFLLAGSRERTSAGPFVRNRALRILPGYWVALAFVAVIAAPVASSLSGVHLVPGDAVSYLVSRLVFVTETSDTGLRAVFNGATINGSLWTLPVELLCYVILAIVPGRLVRPVVVGELACLVGMGLVAPQLRGPDTGLMLAFVAGAAAWCFRDRIVVAPIGAAVAALVAGVGIVLGAYPMIVLGVGYLVLGAAWLPFRMERDLSYGVYVFAYPVQVLVAMTAVRVLGHGALVAVSVALVLPMALLSWTLVERPAMALRHRSLRRAPTGLVVAKDA